MSVPQIGLIACANGLGHIRRMLALCNALRNYPVRPIMLAPSEAVVHLCEIYQLEKPEVIDCRMPVRTGLADQGRYGFDINNLPKLEYFSEIVSDNIIEVLEIFPRAWLSGTFFWHKALAEYPAHWSEQAENILSQHHPRMIASALFAPSYLEQFTTLYNVGLYCFGKTANHSDRTGILISSGKGGNVLAEMKTLVSQVIQENRPNDQIIWLEPALYESTMPEWVRPANFRPEMYNQLAAAVVRPGVGTLTDLLIAGVKPFMFYEAENLEMRENASRVSRQGLGLDCVHAQEAWLQAVIYSRNSEANNIFRSRLRQLDLEGANQAAGLIAASALS